MCEMSKKVREQRPDFKVSHIDHEGLAISPLHVMKSNAGHYVGRSCLEDMGDGDLLEQPYSRDSGYHDSTGAKRELAYMVQQDVEAE